MDMKPEEGKRMIEVFPEGCIAKILSHTTPADSCGLSLVCKGFCFAAKSDTVWDCFLPSDLISIISDSQSASSLFATSRSKKSLYLTLSDHPIIIDNGKKVSFSQTNKSVVDFYYSYYYIFIYKFIYNNHLLLVRMLNLTLLIYII